MNAEKHQLLQEGTVIPAHPLALTADRTLDEILQKRLTRYYLSAGVGGLAVGVHTTQFSIRDPKHNLYEIVLELAMQTLRESQIQKPRLMIAGVCGPTKQAIQEARTALALGYDMALISTNGLADLSEQELLLRAKEIASIMPIFGFYLQPSVGGRLLSEKFWTSMASIENLFAIKIAPFNRYQTLDVVRGVCRSGRAEKIALYTGNDDNIALDLMTTFEIQTPLGTIQKQIVGGLLGHWAVWTKRAVELLEEVKQMKSREKVLPASFLTYAQKITDSNAAFFDAKNNFKGCIAGIHEVLRRQGLMKGTWCLDPEEKLSPGQKDEIDRVYKEYPDLNDDDFVRQFLINDPSG